MDVLSLIDRLEALVNSGTHVPLTSKALLDEQEFLELVDQLRVAVPHEIRQAKRVSQERERVISQAQSDADRVLSAARERADQLVEESSIIRSAQQRAAQLQAGADEYALEVIEGLDSELNRLLASVRKGKAALEKLALESA